jgi:hypothetical protein
MHEFQELNCSRCDKPEVAVNLDSCMICDAFNNACNECLTAHRQSHSTADVEAFRREMMDEPTLTTRERINLEMKQQIRQLAETLCKFIDDQEALINKHENQERLLAQEVDRRMTVQ